MELTKEQIKQGLDKAYKEAGHNAYFGNGFEAGVKYAQEQFKILNIPVVMHIASRPAGICAEEWWCPNCKRVLDDKEVTFDERHHQENCYAKVL